VIRRREFVQRGKPPPRRRATPRRRGADYVQDDDAFKEWVRRQPCVAAALRYPAGDPDVGAVAHQCPSGPDGDHEADHVGERGGGQKGSGADLVCLCRAAHAERHGGGLHSFWWRVFSSKYARQKWLRAEAGRLRKRYLDEVAGRDEDGGIPW